MILARVLDHARADAKRRGRRYVEIENLLAALLALHGPETEPLAGSDIAGFLNAKASSREAGTTEAELGPELKTLLEAHDPRAGAVDLAKAALRSLGREPRDATAATAATTGAPDDAAQETASTSVEAQGADSRSPSFDPTHIRAVIAAELVGQEAAIEQIVSRLGLTRRKLDLRPERPDGVFLLAGPTGVGKTAFARALTRALNGSEDQLVRLDMSEYSHDWAVSRLIGPQPGYVGYDQPDGWLTSRLLDKVTPVLLLDEIEKAHPVVWNTFLQVFDSGRLTDSRNRTVAFEHVVVLMTSNMGADVFDRRRPLGFGDRAIDNSQDHVLVRQAIERVMPPELINRLDDIIVFRPLSTDDIAQIALLEINRACIRIRETYDLTVDEAVIRHIAQTGYDPTYGARHLHRNIEKLLLTPLAAHDPGRYEVYLGDGIKIRAQPA